MTALINWDTTAYNALEHLQARRASLYAYANRLIALQKSGRGIEIPCAVLDAYNRAVNDYFSFGRKVFKLLADNKMTIEQVRYVDGKPSVDAQGNVRTLKIDAPLWPPIFVFDQSRCPNITRVNGTPPLTTAMGIPLIPVAAFAAYAFITGTVAVAVMGVGGYVSVEILKRIKMLFTLGPDWEPDKQVAAYLKCVDSMIAKGFSKEEAAKGCGPDGAMKIPPQGTNWGMILLGTAAIGGIAYVVSKR